MKAINILYAFFKKKTNTVRYSMILQFVYIHADGFDFFCICLHNLLSVIRTYCVYPRLVEVLTGRLK